jgi:hypothetical protein
VLIHIENLPFFIQQSRLEPWFFGGLGRRDWEREDCMHKVKMAVSLCTV